MEPKNILDKFGFLQTWESYQNFAVQHKLQISMLKLEHLSEEFENFEDKLKRIENKKVIVDLSRMKSLGLIEHFLTLSTEDKLYDKLFQIFLNQIMPYIYRLVEVPTIRGVSKLNIESNTLEGFSYQLNSLFKKLDFVNIYDCIEINSSLAKYTNLDESDKCNLQQSINEYWDQLLRVTPKIDQNIQIMSEKNSSRLSEWIEENDTIIYPAENINERRFYGNAISSTIISYTTKRLDPISMLTNTLQRTRISRNSLFSDNQRGRATAFSNESNNNHLE